RRRSRNRYSAWRFLAVNPLIPESEIVAQRRHELTGRGSRRSCRDTAEVDAIDIHVRIRENRMVQEIDRVQLDLQLLTFCNSHALDQIHIQLEIVRALEPFQTETAI